MATPKGRAADVAHRQACGKPLLWGLLFPLWRSAGKKPVGFVKFLSLFWVRYVILILYSESNKSENKKEGASV